MLARAPKGTNSCTKSLDVGPARLKSERLKSDSYGTPRRKSEALWPKVRPRLLAGCARCAGRPDKEAGHDLCSVGFT